MRDDSRSMKADTDAAKAAKAEDAATAKAAKAEGAEADAAAKAATKAEEEAATAAAKAEVLAAEAKAEAEARVLSTIKISASSRAPGAALLELQQAWVRLLPQVAVELRAGKDAYAAVWNGLVVPDKPVPDPLVFHAPGGSAPVVYDAAVADSTMLFMAKSK